MSELSPVKERPSPVICGKTIREWTPWGSLYVTLNFDSEGPFEVFIAFGKSGSEMNAMTEALARVVSIGLRSGCRLEDFIATLKGLSGKEVWMFDHDEEQVIRSVPDAVARLLEKLTEDGKPHVSHAEPRSSKPEPPSRAQAEPRHSDVPCPECGAPMELIAGCAYCFSCDYSPCK